MIVHHPEKSPRDWFEQAAHWYVEGHQACVWCHGRYRVFREERMGRLAYSCNHCDFFVSRDLASGAVYMSPGEIPLDQTPSEALAFST